MLTDRVSKPGPPILLSRLCTLLRYVRIKVELLPLACADAHKNDIATHVVLVVVHLCFCVCLHTGLANH